MRPSVRPKTSRAKKSARPEFVGPEGADGWMAPHLFLSLSLSLRLCKAGEYADLFIWFSGCGAYKYIYISR